MCMYWLIDKFKQWNRRWKKTNTLQKFFVLIILPTTVYITIYRIPVLHVQLVYKVKIDLKNLSSRHIELFYTYFLDSSNGSFIQYSYDQRNSVTQNMTLTFDTNLGTYTNGTIGWKNMNIQVKLYENSFYR
jgi:uncharacterized membrane protein